MNLTDKDLAFTAAMYLHGESYSVMVSIVSVVSQKRNHTKLSAFHLQFLFPFSVENCKC